MGFAQNHFERESIPNLTTKRQRKSYASKKERVCRKRENYVSSHIGEVGALGRIRTPDPLIRSQVLYPAELPKRVRGDLDPTRQERKSKNERIFRFPPIRLLAGEFQNMFRLDRSLLRPHCRRAHAPILRQSPSPTQTPLCESRPETA